METPPKITLTIKLRSLFKENTRGLKQLKFGEILFHGARYDDPKTHFSQARSFAFERWYAGEYCYANGGIACRNAKVLRLRLKRDVDLIDVNAFPIAMSDEACRLVPSRWQGAAFQMHILPSLAEQFLNRRLDGFWDGEKDILLSSPEQVIDIVNAEEPPTTKREWRQIFGMSL
ncbi:hypothetical protein GALL_266630 [mine drainage metagenome]|uniref:Uncharacterized protein n=1 Tax=mine drainage metagenome TaxID=410659 RepID=A0A1J5R6D5_9ZZZZ